MRRSRHRRADDRDHGNDHRGFPRSHSRLTTANPRITAVCAYNDDVALALLAGMRELGLTAPADLAVIGMDDIPAAAFAAPALTTINSDISGLSRHVADTVLSRLNGKTPPQHTPPAVLTVITRETT